MIPGNKQFVESISFLSHGLTKESTINNSGYFDLKVGAGLIVSLTNEQ